MAVATRFYQESSLLPVAEQVAWDRALFLQGAAEIAAQLGFEEWKKAETARTLENIFNAAVNAGKTFDQAVIEVEEAIERAVSSEHSVNQS